MEDITFNKRKEFKSFFSELVPFSKDEQGQQGTVYRNGDLVMKKLKPSEVRRLPDFLEFRDLEIPHFYFPKAGIYIKRKVRGCITEYADGRCVEFLDESIDLILRLIDVMEQDVKNISKERIKMRDIHDGNVLVTDDHFNFIDTLFYYRSTDENEDVLYANHKRICAFIYDYVIPPELKSLLAVANANNVITDEEYKHEFRVVIEKLLEVLKNYVPFTCTTLKEAGVLYRERRRKGL